MQPQIKIYDFDQRSPEWYKIREGKVTGTSVVNILGKADVQKTKDAIDNLAMKLAIEVVFGMIESDYVDFDMQRGIDLEPSAIGLLADILSEDFINNLLKSEEEKRAILRKNFIDQNTCDQIDYSLGRSQQLNLIKQKERLIDLSFIKEEIVQTFIQMSHQTIELDSAIEKLSKLIK